MLYMHICLRMYFEFTEGRRRVSIEQNIEDAGGSGNKRECSEEGERSKRQKETGVCLPTALDCFYSTKEL